MESIGKTLRDKRIEKGLTIEDVSDAIKIRRKYLEAIESGNYSEIPDIVYTKSFLKIYAEYLGLDRVLALKRFMDETSQEESVSINQKSSVVTRERNYLNASKRGSFSRWATYASFLLIIGLLAWISIAFVFNADNSSSEMPSPPAREQESLIDETQEPPIQDDLKDREEETSEDATYVPDPTIPLDQIEVPDQEPEILLDTLSVVLTCTNRAWVSHAIDDETSESFIMSPNETRTINAERRIMFNFGNAGGLHITINQFELGVIGASGEVMDLEVILSPTESIQVNVIKDGNIIDTKIFTR